MLFPRGSNRFGAHPLPFNSPHIHSLLFRRISVNLIYRPLHSNSQQVICFLLISEADLISSTQFHYFSMRFNSTAIRIISMPMLIRASLCVSIPMHLIAKLIRRASIPRPYFADHFYAVPSRVESCPFRCFSLRSFAFPLPACSVQLHLGSVRDHSVAVQFSSPLCHCCSWLRISAASRIKSFPFPSGSNLCSSRAIHVDSWLFHRNGFQFRCLTASRASLPAPLTRSRSSGSSAGSGRSPEISRDIALPPAVSGASCR